MAKGFRDGLPVLKVSRLRATGVIAPDATSVEIAFDPSTSSGLRRTIGLWHMHFPNGGSWSYFLCPGCGVKAQNLRLVDGRVACRRCDGLTWRLKELRGSGGVYRAGLPCLEANIARLEARLRAGRERLKVDRGLERRDSLIYSLRRTIAIKRRLELKGFDGG